MLHGSSDPPPEGEFLQGDWAIKLEYLAVYGRASMGS